MASSNHTPADPAARDQAAHGIDLNPGGQKGPDPRRNPGGQKGQGRPADQERGRPSDAEPPTQPQP